MSFPLELCAHASWARFPATWLRSRRLTEPPRPMRCGEHTKKIFRNIDFTCHNLIYWFQSRSVLVGHCDPAFSLLRLFLFVNSDTRGNAEVWGRGRFSKRSASPPDPLSRRVAGVRVGCSFIQVAPVSWVRFPAAWLWSRWLTEPPRPQPSLSKTRPHSGGTN